MSSTKERVEKVIKDMLWGNTDSPAKYEDSLEDAYDADSLDVVEVAMALEDEFGVEIDDDEVLDPDKSTKDWVDLVTAKAGR